MTGQISDKVLYGEETYSVIGRKGRAIFSPKRFGMTPAMLHTGCYRGFYATYELANDEVYLRELTLRTKNGRYLAIDGVEPGYYYRGHPVQSDNGAASQDDFSGWPATYKGLNVPIRYSGKIRLAKDPIKDLYIRMGYQKATSFKTVLDVTLRWGCVVEVRDRSQEMEQKRGDFKKYYESGPRWPLELPPSVAGSTSPRANDRSGQIVTRNGCPSQGGWQLL